MPQTFNFQVLGEVLLGFSDANSFEFRVETEDSRMTGEGQSLLAVVDSDLEVVEEDSYQSEVVVIEVVLPIEAQEDKLLPHQRDKES